MERRTKIRLATGKINVQPALGFRQDGVLLLYMLRREMTGKIVLSLKPQAGQSDFIRRQQSDAQR